MSLWQFNDHGHWCPSCGQLIARPGADAEALPDECPTCGFPDADQVAAYHLDDDIDEEALYDDLRGEFDD